MLFTLINVAKSLNRYRSALPAFRTQFASFCPNKTMYNFIFLTLSLHLTVRVLMSQVVSDIIFVLITYVYCFQSATIILFPVFSPKLSSRLCLYQGECHWGSSAVGSMADSLQNVKKCFEYKYMLNPPIFDRPDRYCLQRSEPLTTDHFP